MQCRPSNSVFRPIAVCTFGPASPSFPRVDDTRLRWEGHFPYWQEITKDWNENQVKLILRKFHCLKGCLVAYHVWLAFDLPRELCPEHQSLTFLLTQTVIMAPIVVTVLQGIYILYAIELCKWHMHLPYCPLLDPSSNSRVKLQLNTYICAPFWRKLGEQFRWGT